MRYLEVRRHTLRTMPGQHLSQSGVSLARQIGNTMPSFDLVITSTLSRAYETAIAMGFAVHEQLEALAMMNDAVANEINWDAGFVQFARVVKQGGATSQFAHQQAALWRSIASKLPADGHGLIISHGGIVEAGAVACLPDANHQTWGGFCNYCEGVRLQFDGQQFIDGEVLRVPQ